MLDFILIKLFFLKNMFVQQNGLNLNQCLSQVKKDASGKKAACSWTWFLSLNLSSSSSQVRLRSGEGQQAGEWWPGDNVCLISFSHSLFDFKLFVSM